jgi:putative pyruvate formate lyase activating enzyme
MGLEGGPRPSYLRLHENGELAERARVLDALLENCTLCPRRCRVNRKAGKTGACGVDARARVAAINMHPWEEPPVSGPLGSGTVFFSGCTMKCLFCQNYPISQLGVGRTLSAQTLATEMVKLQGRGAANINLVTPTHQVGAFLSALVVAVPLGLRIPIVYNTSGYESPETLRLLEGVVDIYLPDIKYADPRAAAFCSRSPDYVSVNRKALLEMWRQVGPLRLDEKGTASRGMLVRHLVLPEDLSGTRDCIAFLSREFGSGVWVSLMDQYFPAHEAHGTPPLDRKLTPAEYQRACDLLTELGIDNGFVQEHPED